MHAIAAALLLLTAAPQKKAQLPPKKAPVQKTVPPTKVREAKAEEPKHYMNETPAP